MCNYSFLYFEHYVRQWDWPDLFISTLFVLRKFVSGLHNPCKNALESSPLKKKKNPPEYFIEHENDLFLECLLAKTALALSPFVCRKFTTFFTFTAVIDLLRNYIFFLSQFWKCIFFPENWPFVYVVRFITIKLNTAFTFYTYYHSSLNLKLCVLFVPNLACKCLLPFFSNHN